MSPFAVIPARLGATRLPRKPLRLLAGRPLVVRVWERVSAMGIADRCVIATDSEEVAARREFHGFGIVLNVQGDEPFISADAVRGAVAMVKSNFEVGTAAVRAPAGVLGEPTGV